MLRTPGLISSTAQIEVKLEYLIEQQVVCFWAAFIIEAFPHCVQGVTAGCRELH
jgi:hypothetical protein